MLEKVFLICLLFLIAVCQIRATDSESGTVPALVDSNVIIGATAVVLCLVLGITVIALRSKKCNDFKLERNDAANETSDDGYSVRNNSGYEIPIEISHDNLSNEKKLNSSYCLKNFEEGNIDGINLELTLDEQADLLPYDRKFEFPKEKLQLGKQLGTGAFGVVFQAIAIGILSHEEETTVAVKMLKSFAGDEVLRALALELKILIYLGKHLNVVNLLGAITENIAERELMLIVEYCPFGNLQNFLVQHRVHFIDQLNREEDRIDSTIKSRDSGISVGNGYLSFDRACNINKSSVRSITTTDLLCWSFQIARGMHYLASRRVLHGDLAARNILLCEGNVVKICDFGLARSIYNTGDYHIKTERALPYKWLAIESISDQVFSTYSDVWSFGIVLWELFSLGATPYPGMNAGTDLFQKLKDGYRMEKPEYSTKELYKVMLSCWQETPSSRPLFDKLQQIIANKLDRSVSEHYILLNEPYRKLNDDRKNLNRIGFLTLLDSSHDQSQSISASIQNDIQQTSISISSTS